MLNVAPMVAMPFDAAALKGQAPSNRLRPPRSLELGAWIQTRQSMWNVCETPAAELATTGASPDEGWDGSQIGSQGSLWISALVEVCPLPAGRTLRERDFPARYEGDWRCNRAARPQPAHASESDRNQFGLSSSCRTRLLKDSQKALSDGRPGPEKSSLTRVQYAH